MDSQVVDDCYTKKNRTEENPNANSTKNISWWVQKQFGTSWRIKAQFWHKLMYQESGADLVRLQRNEQMDTISVLEGSVREVAETCWRCWLGNEDGEQRVGAAAGTDVPPLHVRRGWCTWQLRRRISSVRSVWSKLDIWLMSNAQSRWSPSLEFTLVCGLMTRTTNFAFAVGKIHAAYVIRHDVSAVCKELHAEVIKQESRATS